MYKLSQADASEHIETPEFEGHYGQLGEFTIGFEHFPNAIDPAPLFVGLPDDSCQARHWGVVLAGRLTFNLTDGTSVDIDAGEAYYIPPGGHRPVLAKGTRLIEFSPTDELAATLAVVERNMAAMDAG